MEWRPCPHFPAYMVSDTGKVMARKRTTTNRRLGGPPFSRTYKAKFRKQQVGNAGYYLVLLTRFGERKGLLVHRLICEAFHGPPPSDQPTVEHIDGVRLNNHANNLCWASYAEQREGERRRGTLPMGERHYKSVLTDAEVAWVREVFVLRDPSYGAIPLGEKFGVTRACISQIIRGGTRN